MPIDYALILGAGLGTRMGEIGKVIPKVIWPIYFKSMLELQIRYCEELGIQKIYLNTHFLHDEVLDYLNREKLFEKVIVLHEKILLDSGGAIHNLASRPEVNYEGKLLLVNGDQFLFFEKNFLEKAILKLENMRAVLFGISVGKDSHYNETVVHDDMLVEIKKNESRSKDYFTYSGIGLLNLNGLKPVEGVSRFFETVSNYKKEKVKLLIPENLEYWDFGTADSYSENILKLKNIKNKVSKMWQFLNRNKAFVGDDLNFVNLEQGAIDLNRSAQFVPGHIKFKSIIQKI
jgi:mannose-1-phosphate guanylyltransferase